MVTGGVRDENTEHPFHRIMKIVQHPHIILIKTSEIHLPQRIGEARRHARGDVRQLPWPRPQKASAFYQQKRSAFAFFCQIIIAKSCRSRTRQEDDFAPETESELNSKSGPIMKALAKLIRQAARPLTGSPNDYDCLLDLISDARIVLLGEASHGTHEFYRERAQITKRLINERGFVAVGVEADWPDAYRVHRYVCGKSVDANAVDALAGFKRFPAWMWRNADVVDFIGWLREHNDSVPARAEKVGFYGLDLYSLHSSIEAVLAYLNKIDPKAACRARARYACFDHFGKDLQDYGLAAGLGISRTCEEDVVNELTELRLREAEYLERDGRLAADEFFFAEQNARLIKNAEQYYRLMFHGSVSSWNLRDRHMVETLASLENHLKEQQQAKIVVWAHNSHLGDARATEMKERGEFNVGQCMRQQHGRGAVLVGFTTHSGTVTAASEWDAPAERKRVRPALEESYEAAFHEVPYARFMLDLRTEDESVLNLRAPRLERAIGVIYRPETERTSHYFEARLADQFDAVFHFDKTRAVEPLERTVQWQAGEIEETFPTGL